MIDWLAVWGVTQAVGFIFKPIFEDLAKDIAKDWAKDLLKSIPKQCLQQLKKEDIEIAAGKALKEFLQLMQQELEDADLEESELQKYIQPLKQFIRNLVLIEILGRPFHPDCQNLDTQVLANTWYQMNLPILPDTFDWETVSKRYLKKVKAIIRESDKLRPILDSKHLEETKASLQQIAGIPTDFDLLGYQEGIRERYGNLKLDSLDTTGYAYNELKLWRMFIAPHVREVHQVLPHVHELPKEYLRRLRASNQLEDVALDELEGYKQFYFDQPIRSVLDIINDKQNYKYIVILGDPGSGKSTLLQFLALNWAETPLNNVTLQPIPLLIELRTYIRRRDNNECNNFLEFFHKCSGNVHHLNQLQLHEQLKAGNALVMFDGLDEVFEPGKREDVITDIHRFTNQYPDTRVILTSRVIGYKPQRLRDAEFRHFMLQDLDAFQIQDFIHRWHELTFQDEVDKLRKQERLQRAIDTSKAIAELAGNPLLLTMMAILNRNQELPRDRATLYEQASRVLLHQWDVERALVEDSRLDPKTIDYKDKQAMLRQVAYHMQTSKKGLAGNIINVVYLERILIRYLKNIEFENPTKVARVMINQLRTRNFMLCFLGADYYAFVHRTFLEYFCAWELVWQFKETQILSIKDLKTEVFDKHWRDETWHEVLRLITGMIEPRFVCEIIDYLMSLNGELENFINLFLAAKCLAEVRNRLLVAGTAHKLLHQIKELTKYDNEYVRQAAVQELARSFKDDPETLPWLKQQTTADTSGTVRQVAVQELARNFRDNADILFWLKQCAKSDVDWTVRQVAVQELARGFPDDPDTLPILKQSATTDENEYVRQAAVQELARGFKHHSEILVILQQSAKSDKYSDVRQAAVQELARNFPDEPHTLSWLKKLAIADDDKYIRRAAVQELARGFKHDPDVVSILQQRAIADQYSDVRRAAVQELARNFKHDSDTLPILKQRATADDNEYVRRAALQELARGFKDNPDILSILKKHATSDKYSDVRQAAVQELARGFKDDPETLIILKKRATVDKSSVVRQAAVQELARGFPDEPGIFDVFYNCAMSDSFEREYNFQDNPRQIALEAITENYPQHPQTLSLLRDRAENDPDEQVREFARKNLALGTGDEKF